MKKQKIAETSSFDDIKRCALIAMFMNEEISTRVTLKGGNALSIAYAVGSRASFDLDFSVERDFESLEWLQTRITTALQHSFQSKNLIPFDIKVESKPEIVSDDLKDFWGGYTVEFKVIDQESYAQLQSDVFALRNYSVPLGGPNGKRVYTLELSKYEYCVGRRPVIIEDCTVYVYSPDLIVAEKLRALCQHTAEYAQIVHWSRNPSPRARDFFDIYTIMTLKRFQVKTKSTEFHELVTNVFAAKRVPLALLGYISSLREFHRADFESVVATLSSEHRTMSYDRCFDRVVRICSDLKTLWNKKPP